VRGIHIVTALKLEPSEDSRVNSGAYRRTRYRLTTLQFGCIIHIYTTHKGYSMIRFMLGLVVVMGSVGGLEHDTATITQALLGCAVGLLLMMWALPKLIQQGQD
jgi:hypothetical protein